MRSVAVDVAILYVCHKEVVKVSSNYDIKNVYKNRHDYI